MDQRTVSSVIAGRLMAGAPGGRIRAANPARLDGVVSVNNPTSGCDRGTRR